jgi:hypothetical protein
LRQGAFETRFSHGTFPATFQLSQLTPKQLDDYEALLSDELEAARYVNARLRQFNAANEYVLAGGLDREELNQATAHAQEQP